MKVVKITRKKKMIPVWPIQYRPITVKVSAIVIVMSTTISQYRFALGSFSNCRNKVIKFRNKSQNIFASTSYKTFFPLLILICMTHLTYDHQLQSSRNFVQKCTNGNQNIKIVHWNKGSANFSNKINQINTLITIKIHIFWLYVRLI